MADFALGIADIEFPSQVFDLSFHPNRNVIASGQINGEVNVHSFGKDGNTLLMELKHHKKACRAVQFSTDGLYLTTASKDKTIQAVDMNTGSICRVVRKAHESPINCLKILNQYLLATGDDNGGVKFWDTRTSSSVGEFSENEDYISGMECDKDNRTLLAASGDGTLSVYNIRRKRFEARSENQENELLSLAVVKNGSKVICGTSDGVLHIFTWDQWSDINDRLPGHPMSVDACVTLTEDIICTGSMDGIIRAVSILPNRFVGVVGEHGEFPIEQISLSPDKNILASCSHDQKIKFWDVKHFKEMTSSEDIPKTTKSKKSSETENFFEDL
ncbi:WD repeat-containing protein 55-like [Dendronephthya gigantea]|uniref:WD repeat-containing protein 55-like n=1 Tax=Dendronephthya gigantea TaxID=151771 RepID=UPI00106B440B|nr:WD repeat-containing protein 55-like [Dendronephthya gigantea]